jgi:predicted nucleic acid-binding protein
MSGVLVDTSAFYAILDESDREHATAASRWQHLLDGVEAGEATARTHGGVVMESSALIQHRLGVPALRALHEDLLPVVGIRWVDQALSERAVSALLTLGSRRVSLVDCMSFEQVRAESLGSAFTFDTDFSRQGIAHFGE